MTRARLFLIIAERVDRSRFTPFGGTSFRALGSPEGPRPDLFVALGNRIDNPVRPTAEDIALVIEVSSSSRRKDVRKAETYAKVGTPEYWLVDLEGDVVIVYRDPTTLGSVNPTPVYQRVDKRGPGATITSSTVDGLALSTDDLLKLAQKQP